MSRRWIGRARGYAMYRQLGWRQSLVLYLAVLFTFSVMGFFVDLTALDRLDPWSTVIVSALLCGVSSTLFLAAAIRGPWWYVGAVASLLLIFASRKLLPGGPDPALHPPTIAQLVAQAQFDGIGCLLSAVIGYTLFVTFIGRQGTRMVRLDTEIGLAKQIQAALAPPIARRFGRFELAGNSVPSSEVGGDLLDAFERDGALVALVADVSGHGVPASTLMAMTRSAIRVRLDTPATLAALCADLHRHLAELGRTDRFVTLAALRLAPGGTVELANAGHPPLLRLRRGGATIERFESLSVPLGIPGEHRFPTATTDWRAGDTFVLFTDGIPEVTSRDGIPFGIDGIERILLAVRDAAPAAIAGAITVAARAHGRSDDDQTVLVLRVLETREDDHGA